MKKILWNDNWEFVNTELTVSPDEAMARTDWSRVDLPHDWLIYDSNHLYESGMGYYRKSFVLENTAQVNYLLRFGAIYQDSQIFCNGQKVGEWKYGYNTFMVDLQQAVTEGENTLLVAVRYESPNSRWYSGAGIIRDVYLMMHEGNYIVPDGAYIRTGKLSSGQYELKVSTEVCLSAETLQQAADGAETMLRYRLLDMDGTTVREFSLSGDVTQNETTSILCDAVKEWSTDVPYLYTLQTELVSISENGEKLLDVTRERFGFRDICMSTEQGLLLNGRHMKINGVCIHHDLGALGAAFNRHALARQLRIQKKMGVNAIRTSHNMPAEELLELADEMGFLVDDEMFDMWKLHKTEHDYATWFEDWMARDVANFVRRDRNHACLLMWSVGNEIFDTHANPESGLETIRALRDETLRHDPERNGVVTFASNFLEGESTQTAADELKVVGYNYLERLYEEHHKKHPDWVIYGSETASTVQSRGVYHFPYEEQILVDVDEQCSSLGNCTTSWGAKNTEYCILAERDTDFSMGQFIWTGYDYIGEPTPYHTKNSYFGQVDTAGFPKDSYYLYQSAWTDAQTNPMVHLFPHWDFNPGQIIDVRACTNGSSVELVLNGRSLGEKTIDHLHGTELCGHWKVPYEAGELMAIAYDDSHREIARDVQHSYGDAVAITSSVECFIEKADGRSLYFIEVGMADEYGNPVRNANNRVSVHVEGPARLIGLDNGDSTDYDSYKGTSRKLFGGKLLVMIATTKKAGYIAVTLSSEGMEKHRIYLTAEDASAGGSPQEKENILQGVSCEESNETYTRSNALSDARVHEIPIRKIELRCEGGQTLDADHCTCEVEAILYPSDATYRELVFEAVNASGVATNIVKLDRDSNRVKLTAMGDGAFYLRCYTRNGTDKVGVLSQLEFAIEGIGSAYMDPYAPISASLYDVSAGELGKSLEHGIATDRGGSSYFGFTNVDFGDFGSDAVTIPCFAFSSCKDYRIRVWSGIPEAEGSECLVDGIYNKETIWDTYIPETFPLTHRIKGIHTICIQTEEFINIREIVFSRPNKGTSRVYALEKDNIYGDEFTLGEEAILDIGNNVSIDYNGMDFGAGVRSITVCGRSHIEKNTIHLKFTAPDGSFTRQMIEVPYSDDFAETTFPLEPVTGPFDVTMIFLPGSRFDLKWIHFQG